MEATVVVVSTSRKMAVITIGGDEGMSEAAYWHVYWMIDEVVNHTGRYFNLVDGEKLAFVVTQFPNKRAEIRGIGEMSMEDARRIAGELGVTLDAGNKH